MAKITASLLRSRAVIFVSYYKFLCKNGFADNLRHLAGITIFNDIFQPVKPDLVHHAIVSFHIQDALTGRLIGILTVREISTAINPSYPALRRE